MHGQQINLKWKSFHSNILSSFESMWEEEGLVDVTLATDGRCLKAHKIMLSASSPFFKKIFQMNPCQHPVIVLQDVHYSELESILKFVYKGEVSIMQENLPLLLRAAETLQIRGLCRHLNSESFAEEVIKIPYFVFLLELTINMYIYIIVQASKNQKKDRIVCEKFTKSPPSSPKNQKKVKSHHNHEEGLLSPSSLYSHRTELSIPVYPVAVDEIKCEPGADSPESNEPRENPTMPRNSTTSRIIDSDEDDNGNFLY